MGVLGRQFLNQCLSIGFAAIMSQRSDCADHDTPVSVGKAATIRTEHWTYCRRLYEADELYDRRSDPHELANLAGQPEHAQVLNDLSGRVLDWMMATADVFPWDEDGRFDTQGAIAATQKPD